MKYSARDIDVLVRNGCLAINSLRKSKWEDAGDGSEIRLAALLFAFKQADPKEVEQSLRSILSRRESKEAFYWLAHVKFEQEAFAEAASAAMNALALAPGDPLCDFMLVSARRGLESSWAPFEPDLGRILAYAPDWPNAHLVAAKTYIDLERYAEAQDALLAALGCANSVPIPDDPLTAFLEYQETGRLATDERRFIQRLTAVRANLSRQRQSGPSS